MPIYLADSNYLRNPDLHRYLRASKANKLAISDHVMMEAMKKSPEITVRLNFWIASQYPRQIIALKGQRFSYDKPIRSGAGARAMIIKQSPDDFAEWYRFMSEAHTNKDVQRYQRDWQGDAIAVQDHIAAQVHGLKIVFENIKATFTQDEILEIKGGRLQREETQQKLLRHIAGMSQSLFERADVPEERWVKNLQQVSGFFLFRYSACMVILFIHYLKNGNISDATAKLINHVVDMELAAEATFFHGILSHDKLLNHMYLLTRQMISLLGGYVMTNGRVRPAPPLESDKAAPPAPPAAQIR